MNNSLETTRLIATIAVICCVLLAVGMVFVCLKLKNTLYQMRALKMTDSDTGIGNRAYFEYHFENTISDYSRNLYYVAYIILDSNFLQSQHGEPVFVERVRHVANVLSAHSSKDEIIARITESGFAIAFRGSNPEMAKQHIESMISKLNIPDRFGDKRVKPVCHAAVYNLQKDDYNCGFILFNLRRNCTKILGTDTQMVFCDEHAMNSAMEGRQLAGSFSEGLANGEFQLYLQFVVDNTTKKIASAEALSRWNHPDKGLLFPGEYIESMESMGMISELDFYMFELVCRQLHKWRDTEFDHLTISCNFTRITLSEEDFMERFKEIASKYVFDSGKLIIEITEDAIEKNRIHALDNILECKKMGFKIALDDLGSGYTTLSNLCDYPIDIVKIDKDIIEKTETENGKTLFKGMVAIAHSLGEVVVCEGVETKEQNEFVSASDCDYIQGWYYSRALPVKESENYYRMYRKEK